MRIRTSRLYTALLTPILGLPLIVWVAIALYISVFIGINTFQYTHFLYKKYDLGIFDQVLWNTAHGRWFQYSFNDYSYLVDHREWLLLPIALLYTILPHPLVLLSIQCVVLAVGVIPIYHLAQYIFRESAKQKREHISIVAALFYLLYPSIQAMNIFEFHMLPFVVPLTLWCWLAIERSYWKTASILYILLLLVREDVALMTMGMGLLILIVKKEIPFAVRWKISAGIILSSVLWFIAMVWIGAVFSPEDSPKFFVYYHWLGATPVQAIQHVFIHPLHTAQHVFSNDHIMLIIALFSSCAFLPLFKPKYILPAICPLLLYMFLDDSVAASVLKYHYSAPIIPWFMIASLYGYREYIQKQIVWKKKQWYRDYSVQLFSSIFIFTFIIGHSLYLGPGSNLYHAFISIDSLQIQQYKTVLQTIEPDDSVFTTESFYPYLSQREHLYPSLNLFYGKKHFSALPYTLPQESIDWVIIEDERVLRYAIAFPFENREDAWKRLRQLIDINHLVVREYTENYVLFGHPSSSSAKEAKTTEISSLVPIASTPLEHAMDINIDNDLQFHGWEYQAIDRDSGNLTIGLSKQPTTNFYDDKHLVIEWKDKNGTVLKQKMFALGVGIDPTHAWEPTPGSYKRITLPIENPTSAHSIQLYISPVIKKKGSLFVDLVDTAIVDPMHTTTILLSKLVLQ